MSSPNEKLSIQKRLLNFVKKNWRLIGLFVFQIVLSLATSYLLTSPYYPYIIPAELSNRVLSSLIDISIALFGFVGLILVFTFRNLLTTKGDLQKEKFEISLKKSQFELQKASRVLGAGIIQLAVFEDEAIKKCDERIEEINNDLVRNEKQIKDASSISFISLGIAVGSILMNTWAFGAIGNEGLHFFNLTLLLCLFFLWLDFIFKLIGIVIEKETEEVVGASES